MSEKEKRIAEKVKEALPSMDDFQKGYLLGMVETAAKNNKPKENENDRKE